MVSFIHRFTDSLLLAQVASDIACKTLRSCLSPTLTYSIFSQVEGDGLVSHCIKPSTVFQQLLQNNEAKFKAHIVGGHVDKIQEFWEGLFSSPQGAELRRLHPNLRDKSPADLRYAIPLRLHEDDGPFSQGGTVNVVSWSPLLAKGKELECKFIFCMYIKLAEQGAAEEAWREFTIDLESLAEGMMGTGEPTIGDGGVNWSGIMLFGGGRILKWSACRGVWLLLVKQNPTAVGGALEIELIVR